MPAAHEKMYLKRVSGISLEQLTKVFRERRIEYRIVPQPGNQHYFRDTVLFVRKSPEELLHDHSIIPSLNDASRRYHPDDKSIELNAFYNFVIPLTQEKLVIDDNYVELKPEYIKRLGMEEGKVPQVRPAERIKIFELNEK